MIGFKDVVCNTNGKGYWSGTAKAVNVTGATVSYVNDEGDFGELRVYFTIDSWDVDTDGLIYTDKQFMKEFKAVLATKLGFTDKQLNNISYSEQGMQGNRYVSMDILSADIINKFAEIETVNA
jgi:hypothetical protein